MPRKPTKKAAKPKKRFVHFETTIPVFKRCAGCQAWVAAGVVDGIHVKADLATLGPTEALFACMAGLQLYSMTRIGLVHLDRYRLEDSKFSGRLPEHRCGVVWPVPEVGATRVQQGVSLDNPPY